MLRKICIHISQTKKAKVINTVIFFSRVNIANYSLMLSISVKPYSGSTTHSQGQILWLDFYKWLHNTYTPIVAQVSRKINSKILYMYHVHCIVYTVQYIYAYSMYIIHYTVQYCSQVYCTIRVNIGYTSIVRQSDGTASRSSSHCSVFLFIL